MPNSSDHLRGLAITAFGVMVLTPDTLLLRLLSLDPWTVVFWRGVLMAVGLAIGLAIFDRSGVMRVYRAIGRPGLAVAACFSASSILFVYSIANTAVANTLIIVATAPMFAAMFSSAFLREHVPLITWGAIAAVMAGIGIVVFGDGAGAGIQSDSKMLGDLAALGTATAMAAIFVLVRRSKAVNMVPSTAIGGLVAALLVLPVAAPLDMSSHDAVVLLVMGLIVLPVSFGLITIGPRYLPAPEVSLLLLLETVLGPYWVWLVLDEQPGPAVLAGGAIVVGSLVIHSLFRLRARG
jgi:drug/metabolite transporter (DMT)-like permease